MTADPTLSARLARLAKQLSDHPSLANATAYFEAVGVAYSTGQLITLADHEAAVKAAVDAERESCAAIAATAAYNRGSMVCGCSEGLSDWVAAAIRARANGGE